MARVLEVVLYPHEVLRKKAEEVTVFDDKLAELAQNLSETMYHYKGIGLAANQVNELKRIFVLDVDWREQGEDQKEVKKAPQVFVNPEIVSRAGELEYEEGCLSIPKVYGLVTRSEGITVRYHNLKGVRHEASLTELRAIAFQHELDHLNGILFFDHLSPFKRRNLIEKFTKMQLDLKKEEE
jgi:peptide deformylase